MTVHLDKTNGYLTSGRPEAIVRNASTALLESILATCGIEQALAIEIEEELDARENVRTLGHLFNAVRLFGPRLTVPVNLTMPTPSKS